MISFKYKEESLGPNKGKIKRPVADIFIKTKANSWIEFHPYIDSGADVTLIPLSLGRLIGLVADENKIQQIGGIRGSVPVIYSKIDMMIGKYKIEADIVWALIEDVPPLLGRKDIFDFFKITFQQYKELIIFDKK